MKARIRTVKPELFIHEDLFDLEEQSGLPLRLAFIGLFCHVDREGRFRWRPRSLGVGILPYDGIDFSQILDELEKGGFVRRYQTEDGDFGFIPSFGKHQAINNKEEKSKLPEPPSPEAVGAQPIATRVQRVEDASKTRAHLSEGEGKGREGKGRELEPRDEDATLVPKELAGLSEKKKKILERVAEDDKRVALALLESVRQQNPGLDQRLKKRGDTPLALANETLPWADQIRLMREQDGRDYAGINTILLYVFGGEVTINGRLVKFPGDVFWKTTMRSGESLRRNYEQISAKVQSALGPAQKKSMPTISADA